MDIYAVDSTIDTNFAWAELGGAGNDMFFRSTRSQWAGIALPGNDLGAEDTSGAVPVNGTFSVAGRYDTSALEAAISVDGATAIVDSTGLTGDLGAGFDLVFFDSSVNQYNHIKKVRFWPDVDITDAGIEEASS